MFIVIMIKFILKYCLIFAFLILNFTTSACDTELENSNSEKQLKEWLGSNSSFSRSYKEGKCALDKALGKLPVNEKKVIANLIAKSYEFEINSIEKLQTYNY